MKKEINDYLTHKSWPAKVYAYAACRENDAGVVEGGNPAQPTLICLLNASQICPLLAKGWEFIGIRYKSSQRDFGNEIK